LHDHSLERSPRPRTLPSKNPSAGLPLGGSAADTAHDAYCCDTVPTRPSSTRGAEILNRTFLLIRVGGILTIVLSSGYAETARSHPTDDELTARFFAHESEFESLVQLLDSDRGRLLSLGAESYEFTDFVPTGAGTAHFADYEALLAKIGSANFRYFPRSGNLTLPASRSPDAFAEAKKSYLYLSREEPQPLRRHQSDSWRGPGVYFITGDRRIRGRWFIHHDGTLVVAFSPY
jgi:hypothetical protein